MRIFQLIILVCLLQSQFSQASQLFPFKIEGSINADTGTVHLEVLFDKDYYLPDAERKIAAKVENEKFSFSGGIPYPQGVTLRYEDSYYSGLFVIEPGTQSIVVNIEAAGEVPTVDNLAMKEYEGEYIKAYEQVRRKRVLWNNREDSLRQVYQNEIPDTIQLDLEREIKGIYAESDSTLLKYVTSNPESYIAFWKFIELFRFVGPQYWDQDGEVSSKLSINKFPTNFLLDSRGHIIRKDLRPVELDQFLWENMR